MVIASSQTPAGRDAGDLLQRYRRVRNASLALAKPLTPEDQVVQTIPEVSPTKWHLAHVTWFFEHFVLCQHQPNYRPFDERFHHLFNSYYYTVGDMYARPHRGLLSRPTVTQVLDFRAHVDEAIARLIEQRADEPDFVFLVELGLHHEQQHQELLLTDIKHVFFTNPLGPAYREGVLGSSSQPIEFQFVKRPGGLTTVGLLAESPGFYFDNETPRHQTLLRDHALANRLVTNGEFRAFIEDGGYSQVALWLSDGWAEVQQQGWQHPMCWSDDLEQEFTLRGWQPIDPHAAVTHVSFYEADAYARWAGARLPTEAEWETVAAEHAIQGNLLAEPLGESPLHPVASQGEGELQQLYGDVWEWTSSNYGPYPGSNLWPAA